MAIGCRSYCKSTSDDITTQSVGPSVFIGIVQALIIAIPPADY